MTYSLIEQTVIFFFNDLNDMIKCDYDVCLTLLVFC